MRLETVSIRGFRGYKDIRQVRFNDLTTIIGKNDIGKSTILEALAIFFKSDVVKIDSSDLCVHSEDRIIEISCTFSGFPEKVILDSQAETELAQEYLLNSDGNLQIIKRWECSGAKPKEEVFVHAHHPTADQYGDLLTLTNTALKNRAKSLGIPPGQVNLGNNPSIRRGIWGSSNNLALAEVDIPVAKEDMNKIWTKLELLLPMFALFQSDRSSRDSDSEVQDPMRLAITAALAEPEVRESLGQIVKAVENRATELATRTQSALSKLDPELARELVPRFKSEPKWGSLFSIALEGDDGIPVNKRGSGVRRLVLVSFFRAEADRKVLEGKKENIIYAIEEPETSQHPRNQRILLDAFRELSQDEGCQVILTTHSPGLAGSLDVDGMRFVDKGKDGYPQVHEGSDDVWQKIALELGVTPDNRVKVLICVEGPTDVDALTGLSSVYHDADPALIDLATDPRVAFVPMGGGTLKNWVANHYLKNLGKPEFHLYDNDVATYSDAVNDVNQRNDGSYATLSNKREIENYLDTEAIKQALGVSVSFGDQDDVPFLVSQALRNDPQRRALNAANVKKRLAHTAYRSMTAARVDAVDKAGEVRGWLKTIEKLAEA